MDILSDSESGTMFNARYLSGVESTFAPKADLADKQNYSRHVFIDRDGGVKEAVRLNVFDDRHREDLIGFHFAQQYAEVHYGEQLDQPQFYVVGRDDPWDFEYVMHDGVGFFLEVCRVADRDLLKAIKIENDVSSLLSKPELKGFEILKIEKHFPGTIPRDLVGIVKTKADKQRKFSWDNSERVPNLFMRPLLNPRVDLKTELETALRKKAAKKHLGKERTIIVIDNLTTHSEPGDFYSAVEELDKFLNELPFNSVWLYTGYYSDDNGYNCEYSLIPIKMSDEEAMYLTEHASK